MPVIQRLVVHPLTPVRLVLFGDQLIGLTDQFVDYQYRTTDQARSIGTYNLIHSTNASCPPLDQQLQDRTRVVGYSRSRCYPTFTSLCDFTPLLLLVTDDN